jgi:hypothetical protein
MTVTHLHQVALHIEDMERAVAGRRVISER